MDCPLDTYIFGEAPEWSRTAHVCTQPDTVSYEEGSSYSVFFREPSVSLTLTPSAPHAFISITGHGTYGNAVELQHSTDPEKVECRWEADRVDIIEPNGIVHSVPASVFIGGR